MPRPLLASPIVAVLVLLVASAPAQAANISCTSSAPAATCSGTSYADQIFIFPNGTMWTIKAGGGNDIFTVGDAGGSSPIIIYGGGGADILHGDGSGDRIFGESGDDQLYGEGGWDSFDGGYGNDLIVGNGNIQGGPGNDTIHAEGYGVQDWIDCGSGTNDTVYYDAALIFDQKKDIVVNCEHKIYDGSWN